MSVFSALGVKEYNTQRYPIIMELFDNWVYLFDKYSNQYTKDSEWPLYEKYIYIWNIQQNALLKANLIKNKALIQNWKLISWWKDKWVTVDKNWNAVSATASAIENQLNDLDPNFTTKIDWLLTQDELLEKILWWVTSVQHAIETTGSLSKETLKARWNITVTKLLSWIQKTDSWYNYSYKLTSYWFDAWNIEVRYNKTTKERTILSGLHYEYWPFKELDDWDFDKAIKIENMTNYCLWKAKKSFWDKAKDIDKPFISSVGFYPNAPVFLTLDDWYIDGTDLFDIQKLYKWTTINVNKDVFVKTIVDKLNFDWNNYYRRDLVNSIKEKK